MFLLRKATAEALETGAASAPTDSPVSPAPLPPAPDPEPGPESAPVPRARTIRLQGNVPAEVWNRLGTRILPKLRVGSDLKVGIDFSVSISSDAAPALEGELRQILQELGLAGVVRVE